MSFRVLRRTPSLPPESPSACLRQPSSHFRLPFWKGRFRSGSTLDHPAPSILSDYNQMWALKRKKPEKKTLCSLLSLGLPVYSASRIVLSLSTPSFTMAHLPVLSSHNVPKKDSSLEVAVNYLYKDFPWHLPIQPHLPPFYLFLTIITSCGRCWSLSSEFSTYTSFFFAYTTELPVSSLPFIFS